MKKDGFDDQGFAINLPKITVKKPDTPVVQQTFVPQQPTFESSRIQQRPNLIPNPVRPFNPPQVQQFPDASSTSSVNAQPPLVSSGSAILAPSVVPGYIPPTTDVRDFIEPHEPGKQCGLLNKVSLEINILPMDCLLGACECIHSIFTRRLQTKRHRFTLIT